MDTEIINPKEDLVTKDLPKVIKLMNDIKTNNEEIVNILDKLAQKLEDGEYQTSKGLSFLELKNHLLLSYLMNMSYIILKKLQGLQLEGEPSIERLVEIRTVMEKMRPIEQKLKYQIDKLVKAATTPGETKDDPLRFRANPSNLVSKMEDESDSEKDTEEETEESKESTKTKLYVPPKLAAMHYDGDLSEKDRQEKLLERARKRALSSSIMRELREEYYEGPEEITESRNVHKIKVNKEMKERINYEEEHMVRLTLSKKEKNKYKNLAAMSNLGDLTHFGDISALVAEDRNEEWMPAKKKKTSQKKGSKGKKSRRKF